VGKTTFSYKSPWQGEVEIPTKIDSYEISMSRYDTIQIEDSDGRVFYYLNPESWQDFARIDHKKKVAHYQPHRTGGLIAFWFGQTGTTRLLLWANSLEDALEECGAWLKEHTPGHITEFSKEDFENAKKEVAEEEGIEEGDVEDEAVQQHLETDMTYTESGYIPSEEWGDVYIPEGHQAPEKFVDMAMAIGHIVEPADYED
jgi:hypothetical protein